MNKQSKTETDSYIQRANWWLSQGRKAWRNRQIGEGD